MDAVNAAIARANICPCRQSRFHRQEAMEFVFGEKLSFVMIKALGEL